MNLLRKLRTLLGALAQRPAGPPSRRGSGVGPDEAVAEERHVSVPSERPDHRESEEDTAEAGRVADLIEETRRERGQSRE